MAEDRAISWNWSRALFGATCCLPAAVILLVTNVKLGIGFAIGVLPVVLMGVLPSRRQRLRGLLLGSAFAVMFFLGSLLSQLPLVAVIGLFAVTYGAVMLTSEKPIGRVVLGVMLPALVVGLSSEGAVGLLASLILLAGTLWATAVAMFWPERSASVEQPLPAADKHHTRIYALLLGSAASLALFLAYVFDFGHLGWAPAAVVLVMRPQPDLLTSRGLGRVLATLAGLVFAWLMVRYQPADLLLALVIVGVVAAIAAIRPSRWYVTPAGTAVLVMLLIGTSELNQLRYALTERFGETLLGVALAYVFGVVAPFLINMYEEKVRSQGANDAR